MQLIDDIIADRPLIESIRHDLHAHPELRYEEHRTSAIVASALEALGIEVERGLGGTGVVGRVRGRAAAGAPARTLGLRADMDALPIEERNTFAHRSRHAGRMHACGHDGHTAILLGAARHLARHPGLGGDVVLIFQPAEEGGGGARRMIEDGLFERFPCDAVFALHNWPGLAAGHMGFSPGPAMASTSDFVIRVLGKGAHAAMPHLGIDPVLTAAQTIQALQGLVTRARRPIDHAVLSVTMIHAGEATNVIPDAARIAGTVRTFDEGVTDLLEAGIRRVARACAEANGARAEVDFERQYPPTVNHERELALAAGVARELLGAERVHLGFEPSMGAEDFAFMLRERPGAYLFLGNGSAEGLHRVAGHGPGPCTLHNASFDFNDNLLPIGASFWVRLAETFLGTR